MRIRRDETTSYSHEGEEYSFSCQACVDAFITDPVKYLRDTEDVIWKRRFAGLTEKLQLFVPVDGVKLATFDD